MAVFVAAADESDGPRQRDAFLYGGFVAPTLDWTEWVVPAWEERVLNVWPQIPYLHMVQIRSSHWRKKYGLSLHQAESRVDEAVRIIASTGSLHPVRSLMDGGHFRDVFGSTRVVRLKPQPAAYQFAPDYIGFLGFAYAALAYVANYCSGAEKVDFVVERKSGVTTHIAHFHSNLADALGSKGETRLVPLIGELIPGGKDRVPLQAADVAMWHMRRHEMGELDAADRRRWIAMFEGRKITVNGLSRDQIDLVKRRSKDNYVPNPFQSKRFGESA